MFVFHENSEQGQHIPLLIIIAVLLAWTLHVALVKKGHHQINQTCFRG